MGRGLSPLQKYILIAAFEKTKINIAEISDKPESRGPWGHGWCPLKAMQLIEAEGRDTRGFRILRPKEVLAGFYGFKSKDPDTFRFSNDRSHDFDRSEIGEKKYRAAAVSVRKAFLRLERRGLIRATNYHWYPYIGAELTPAGIELAEELTRHGLVCGGSPARKIVLDLQDRTPQKPRRAF